MTSRNTPRSAREFARAQIEAQALGDVSSPRSPLAEADARARLLALAERGGFAPMVWPGPGPDDHPPLGGEVDLRPRRPTVTQTRHVLAPTRTRSDPPFVFADQELGIWHGTTARTDHAEISVNSDFRPDGLHHWTGAFEVEVEIGYEGVADFGLLGAVQIACETQVILADLDYVNDAGFVTDQRGVLGLWRSVCSVPHPSVTTMMVASGVQPIAAVSKAMRIASPCGAVAGMLVRVGHWFSIRTANAIACFDGMPLIRTPRPTLTMSHLVLAAP